MLHIRVYVRMIVKKATERHFNHFIIILYIFENLHLRTIK